MSHDFVELENTFVLRPHPRVKTLTSLADGQAVIGQLISEAASGNLSNSNEVRVLIREAALCNLWFFLKVVAGYSGPYNELNDTLHLNMANYRQSDYCMAPGACAAGFISRGHYKSTVWTHGACAWEIVRNPDIRIRIINSIAAKAQEFMRNIRLSFEQNDFMEWLFHDWGMYVDNPKSQARWNEEELVIPARSRNYSEPTVDVSGMGGAQEGSHHDLIVWDDPIGLDDLDSSQGSSAQMESKKNVFKTNYKALVVSWRESRNLVWGTRYAVDDLYQDIIADCRTFVGYRHPSFKVNPTGEWSVYYRKGVEEDQPIMPEKFTLEGYAKMAKENWWFYITQMMNDPQEAGLAEFLLYETRECEVFWSDKRSDWIIVRTVDAGFDAQKEPRFTLLGECDAVMAVDFAGTDKGISAKTSRTAIEIWAGDAQDNKYLIWSRVGYFSIEQIFDYIFEGNEVYSGYIRATLVESNAMQKIIAPLLDKEMRERGKYISTVPVFAAGDKVARIRNIVGQALARNRIWLARGQGYEFVEEKNVFPQAKWKRDTLDCAQMAITELKAPEEEETFRERDAEEQRMLAEAAAYGPAGY